ncbi:helicase associated domain-containing protein [Streptomyces atroolivaceus]|uniref:helicase associated domain-containing protein n=1 Tax=Streptomyces atroolivaceus TaxID=66869 RepID=UPI0033C7288C
MGQAHRRPAVDVRTHPRYRACRPNREADAVHEPGRKVGDASCCRAAVLRTGRHLKVPRKRVERISLPRPGDGRDEERLLRLGAWVANQRSRAATLTADRVDQLSAVGERWT